MLAFRLAITLQNFALAWHYSADSQRPPDSRLSLPQKIALFFGEFYATLLCSSWYMAFKPFTTRDNQADSGLPVLLVHGWGCNSGYWCRFSGVLQAAGIRHFAIDLEPILGPIDGYVPQLAARIDAILAASGAPQVIIVAHSMGGLVTRAYLRAHGSSKLAHAITLGSPHHGTGLANFGMGDNSRQMRFQPAHGASPWLRQLDASETPATRALLSSVWSRDDNIISPQESSQLEHAHNLVLHGMGHVALALHALVQAELLRLVQQQRAAHAGHNASAGSVARAI